MTATSLGPAALAFDAIAPNFDERFGACASVAAQRRAVRAILVSQFPPMGHILEIGGGTGEDALFLAERGFRVLLTDASPAMVHIARQKLSPLGSCAQIVAAEEIQHFAAERQRLGEPLLDGAFSNFAPLNCVQDIHSVAKGLGLLLKPGALAVLVLFGTCCPAEMLVEAFRGRPRNGLRRFKRGGAPATLAKRTFEVFYHRASDLMRAFQPWFELERRTGIGVAVPPSAAEPWISHHCHLLAAMEAFDRMMARSLAPFGDHVLYQFRRKLTANHDCEAIHLD
ncbi:MAG TPA: class I SAM-dependent methyltransferase [Acidobacteriaceae bacterium]|nr:class I SAM-dependent methyltransferase [Acidobacteriaceae bacterium]